MSELRLTVNGGEHVLDAPVGPSGRASRTSSARSSG